VTTSLPRLTVLVPLTALVGWVLAGRALRPVARITESARRASETRLSERLALRGPRDEITELGDTFDAVLDRLGHAVDAQRRFTADASHELRTPLTVARTTIEVVLAKPNRTPGQLTEMAHDVHAALRPSCGRSRRHQISDNEGVGRVIVGRLWRPRGSICRPILRWISSVS